jgi:hypothetical protein
MLQCALDEHGLVPPEFGGKRRKNLEDHDHRLPPCSEHIIGVAFGATYGQRDSGEQEESVPTIDQNKSSDFPKKMRYTPIHPLEQKSLRRKQKYTRVRITRRFSLDVLNQAAKKDNL